MADRIELQVQAVISPDVVSAPRDLQDLQIYLSQYASDLVKDLGLPLKLSIAVISAPVPYGPSTFQLLIHERPCRMRLWPATNLSGLPVRELASVVSEALHYCRVCLLTDAVSDFLAAKWGVILNGKYHKGWTDEGFRSYVRQIVRRNSSLARAQKFVDTTGQAAATQTDAQLCFEETLEQADSLAFGVTLWLSPELYSANQLHPVLEQSINWAATEPGIVLPQVILSRDGRLHSNGFRIQINDVRLPEFAVLPQGFKIPLTPPHGLAELAVPRTTIVDPLNAFIFQALQLSPELEAGFVEKGIQLMDTNGCIASTLSSAIKLYAGSMIAAPVTQQLLERLKRDCPDLVQQVQSTLQSLASKQSPRVNTMRWTTTAILRILLDESVNIRDLRAILEGLVLLRQTHNAANQIRVAAFRTPHLPLPVADGKSLQDLNLSELAQCARFSIRTLALRFTSASFVLSPAISQRLLEAEQKPLTETEIRLIHTSIFNHLSVLPADAEGCIVVAQLLRLKVSHLLYVEFPGIAVLGILELPADLKGGIPAGIIDFPPTPAPSA